MKMSDYEKLFDYLPFDEALNKSIELAKIKVQASIEPMSIIFFYKMTGYLLIKNESSYENSNIRAL